MKKFFSYILFLIPLVCSAQNIQPSLSQRTIKLTKDLVIIKQAQYGYACTNNLRIAILRTEDATRFIKTKDYAGAYESLSHTRNLVDYCRYAGCTKSTDLYYALKDTKKIMKALSHKTLNIY